jgi:hypothetical protein
MAKSKTRYWVFLTLEAQQLLSKEIIVEYIHHDKILICESFNSDSYFLHVVAEPINTKHFANLEFLIPYSFVLTIVTVGSNQKNLGFVDSMTQAKH